MFHSSAILGVGIDVSKAKLDVALYQNDHDEHFIVSNDTKGIKELIQRLHTHSYRIVMESTGRYHLLAAYLLSQASLTVHVVNPLQSRRYITASVRKQKSDKTDARALAHMASAETALPPPFTKTKEEIHIRQKMGLICSIERQLQSRKATMRNYREFQEQLNITVSSSEKRLCKMVDELKAQRDMLQQEIEEMVMQREDRRKISDIACTVPGVSSSLGALIAALFDDRCVSAKQWIHFVGFDVSLHQSGTWKGRGKLSKRGNAYLRKKLFAAAWGAMMHDEDFRAYYDKLRAQGRCYKETMIIIARKLLRILFILIKNSIPFSHDLCIFS